MKTEKNLNNMIKIEAHGARYISQIPGFEEGLPFGIFNKKLTDSGGTFAAMSCKSHYIVVVPFRDLVDSIIGDENVPLNSIGVYNGVTFSEFKDYILSNEMHKIVVTYDSLPKVIKWLDKLVYDYRHYKLLVDEFHLLLEDIGYRESAIQQLMKTVNHFQHYTFMSATPIKDEFLTSYFKELPYTEVVWDRVTNIKPLRIRTAKVVNATVKLINMFLDGNLELARNRKPAEGEDNSSATVTTRVEELYIFLNSVREIKKIINNTKLTKNDVKIVCSDTVRNSKVLEGLPISNITEPNAKVNFFTKKGFQGCNLFTNNGLVVVVSDGNRSNTLVDIETTLCQVSGRIRSNDEYDNVFKDVIWHIYSFRNNLQSPEEYKKYIDEKIEETNETISLYNRIDKKERDLLRNRLFVDDLICYYDEEEDTFTYSELKQKYFEYQYKLSNHVYKDGVSIRNAYHNAGFTVGNQNYIETDDIIIKSITNVGFREMIELYIELKENNSQNEQQISRLETEYPIFKEAYDKLGAKGIRTCGYIIKKIKQKLFAKKDETLDMVYKRFYNHVGEDVFITNKEAKNTLKSIFTDLGIKSEKPTVTLLNKSSWFNVKKTQKRISGKQTDGIKLSIAA